LAAIKFTIIEWSKYLTNHIFLNTKTDMDMHPYKMKKIRDTQ